MLKTKKQIWTLTIVAMVLACSLGVFLYLDATGQKKQTRQENYALRSSKRVNLPGGEAAQLENKMKKAGLDVKNSADLLAADSAETVSFSVTIKSQFVLANPLVGVVLGGSAKTVYKEDLSSAVFRVPANTKLTVVGTADSHFTKKKVLIPTGGEKIVLLLEGFGGVSGIVIDSDGRPVPRVSVKLVPQDRSSESTTKKVYTKRTSEEGEFSISRIPAGHYTLTARKNNYQQKSAVRVEIVALTGIQDKVIVLASKPHVSGFIFDSETGQGLGGVYVTAYGPESTASIGEITSMPDGRFTFRLRELVSKITFVSSHIGYTSARAEFNIIPTHEIQLSMKPVGVPLTIKVIDKHSRKAIVGVSVSLLGRVQVEGGGMPSKLVRATDNEGNALFERVNKDSYSVGIISQKYVASEIRVWVTENEPATATLEVTPSSIVSIQFADQDGVLIDSPVPNTFWLLSPQAGYHDRSILLQSDVDMGMPRTSADISGLPTGKYDLYVLREGYLPFHSPLEIPESGGLTKTIVVSFRPRKSAEYTISESKRLDSILLMQPPAPKNDSGGGGESMQSIRKPMFLEGKFSSGAARKISRYIYNGRFLLSDTPIGFQFINGKTLNLDCREGATLVFSTGHVIEFDAGPNGTIVPDFSELITVSGIVTISSGMDLSDGESYIIAVSPVQKEVKGLPAISAMDCIWTKIPDKGGEYSIDSVPAGYYVLVLFKSRGENLNGEHSWIGTSYYLPLDVSRVGTDRANLPK